MATILQLRRGTTVQHSTFTGAVGEVTVDTTKDTVVVHDGTTAGGKPLATEAYVTSAIQTKDNSDEITEGSTNLYFTNARARGAFTASTGISITDGAISTSITQYNDASARGAISVTDSGGDGSLAYNNTTGVITYTGPSASDVRAHFSASTGISILNGAISSTITQYTDALARASVSVTDSGGDGSLAYNNTTGVITYTGPSATDVRAHFSAGTGVTITDGAVAIGQAVGTGSNVTFNDVTVSGNLTVSGTTTTVNTETINLADNIITLNSNEVGTPSQNAGIEVERGTSTNVTFQWNETTDVWEYTVDGTNYIPVVGTTATQTLTNKTLTSPVISSIVNTGTLTLPTSTDTLVGRATTDTLTNKTISGSNNTLSNIGNASLTNSKVTIGSTDVSLGGTVTTFAGLTSVTSTAFVGALTGNASSVTNGVYTTDTGSVTNTMLAGSIANNKLSNSAITLAGTAVSLGGSFTATNILDAIKTVDGSGSGLDADLLDGNSSAHYRINVYNAAGTLLN
jgi:hypothetical protein